MDTTHELAHIRAAIELIRDDDGRLGRVGLRKHLADAGYAEAIIDEAFRVSRDEALQTQLLRDQRRRDRAPRLRRTRVWLALGVALVLGYASLVLAASSAGGIGASPGPFVFAPPAATLLPLVAAGLIAAAGASKRTARTALVVLILGLPVGMLAGWRSVLGGAIDESVVLVMLIVTAIVAVPALIGYGLGTSAAAR
jgi:hypothetical protein